jgi:hypothetical protein
VFAQVVARHISRNRDDAFARPNEAEQQALVPSSSGYCRKKRSNGLAATSG